MVGFTRIYVHLVGFKGIWARKFAGLGDPVARESWPLKKDCSNLRLQYPKLGDL